MQMLYLMPTLKAVRESCIQHEILGKVKRLVSAIVPSREERVRSRENI